MNHSTGHGVGLECTSKPGVRSANGEPLEEGDVITVEPCLYLIGFGGVRIEDTGMVTARDSRTSPRLLAASIPTTTVSRGLGTLRLEHETSSPS